MLRMIIIYLLQVSHWKDVNLKLKPENEFFGYTFSIIFS